MSDADRIAHLEAQVKAMEDLLVVALALAMRSTPEKHQEMMNMWLLSMACVDVDAHNSACDFLADEPLEEGQELAKPVEGLEAVVFDQRQRIAGRTLEAIGQMFEE